MATQIYTDGVTLTSAAEFNRFDTVSYAVLGTVAGTNTITAVGPANYSYAAATPPVWFVPANTNTAATTINVTPSGSSALGAKNLFWNGAACVGGELRQNVPAAILYDGTQFHIIANGFNAPFLDTHAVVQGSSDKTKKVRFEVDGLTTATERVLTVLDADFTIGGATAAQQEAGSSAVVSVTPSVQQRHPSAAKGWVSANMDGTAASSYNVTSLTDVGAGRFTITWATDFSSVSYPTVGMAQADNAATQASTLVVQARNDTYAAGSLDIVILRVSDGAATDPNLCHVVAFGDQ